MACSFYVPLQVRSRRKPAGATHKAGADHVIPSLPPRPPPSRLMSLAAVNLAVLGAWLLAEIVPLLADALARREAVERDRKP